VLLGALLVMSGISACSGGAASVVGGSGGSGVVVRVGQAAIAGATVEHWLSVMAGGRVVGNPLSRRDRTLRRQALMSLISSEWLIGEAAEEGLRSSAQEIAHRLEERKNASSPNGEAEFHEYLKQTGQTVSDLMFEARAELASAKLRQALAGREPKVTQAQVAAYYSRHRQRFAIPERREVEITNRKSEAEADKIKLEVASGRSFASLAQRESSERSPNIDNPSRGSDARLERAIFSARPNVLTGPVKQHVDYYLFEVKRIAAGSERPLAQVEGSIVEQLTVERQRRALAAFVETWRTKWTARTSCRGGYVVEGCEQYRGPRAPSGFWQEALLKG
jgi:foldase protein PrsA